MMDFFSDLFGGGGSQNNTTVTQNDIRQLPDYAEAEGARAEWWDTLQKWGDDPSYGAIAPNWDEIWQNAKGKISRYFGGGPEGPGVNARVRANNARRGISDNAAADVMLQRSGFQEGNMLQDLAIKQAIEKAQLGESGRKNWLGSLQNLAGLKPSFQNFGSTTERMYEQPNILAEGGQALLENEAGGNGSGMFDQLMGMFGGGDSGIGDVSGGGEDGDYDWLSAIMGIGRMFAGDYVGGGTQVAGTFV